MTSHPDFPSRQWEAEDYAVTYPLFAARICANGRLPARPDFTPSGPATIEALVNGTSPILSALDQLQYDAAEAA